MSNLTHEEKAVVKIIATSNIPEFDGILNTGSFIDKTKDMPDIEPEGKHLLVVVSRSVNGFYPAIEEAILSKNGDIFIESNGIQNPKDVLIATSISCSPTDYKLAVSNGVSPSSLMERFKDKGLKEEELKEVVSFQLGIINEIKEQSRTRQIDEPSMG